MYYTLVLLQSALGFSVFLKYNDLCCSDRLVIIEDPSTFELTDPHKYFQNFYRIYWACYGQQLVFTSQPVKNESLAIAGPINSVKFCKYLCGSVSSKADGSSMMTKRSERHESLYFENTEKPKAGCSNTTGSN